MRLDGENTQRIVELSSETNSFTIDYQVQKFVVVIGVTK